MSLHRIASLADVRRIRACFWQTAKFLAEQRLASVSFACEMV